MNPGIYPNTSRADYDAVEAVNQSTIKRFMPNPWAWKQGLKPFEETASTIHGRLVEAWLFGDNEALKRFAFLDEITKEEMLEAARGRGHKGDFSKSLKEYQLWKSAAAINRKPIVDFSDFTEAQKAADCLRDDPNIADFLAAKTLETNVMIVWRDPKTDLLCKGLVDCHARADFCLCDVKTSVAVMGKDLEGAARKFYYQCLDLGYDIQAGAYLDGWKHAGGAGKTGWRLIVSGNEAPYPPAAFSFDEDMIEAGRAKWHEGLKLWKRCHDSGEFPGLTSKLGWMELKPANFRK